MRKLTSAELDEHFDAVMAAVEAGQWFVISRDGKEIGELGPYRGERAKPELTGSA